MVPEIYGEKFLQDAKLYVSTLLEVHKKYADLVCDAFDNEAGFLQALDRAASSFINK